MVKISEDLIRKRAEHNEGLISTLEELSLHQQNIEKIEYLDKWCKDLKILYLQSNLISKIENVGRLKKLEYLNLALNNIERIENLEGCEFLNKLDLTVNFIGELTSIKNLIENHHLKELFLTGNPCTDFEGYRDYVIATLPQLRYLDGVEINRSDRIKALQNYKKISDKIHEKENEYKELRVKQKLEHEEKKRNLNADEDTEKFWSESSEFTPESRVETARVQEEMKKKRDEAKKSHPNEEFTNGVKKERRFFDPDGRPYSFNDPKVDYEYNCDDGEKITLVVHVYKYMDSSLIDVDVQPSYVRVTLKGKSLQLAFNDEVKPDSSTACRSQVSGDLVITMPKARPHIKPQNENAQQSSTTTALKQSKNIIDKPSSTYLEFESQKKNWKDEVANIVSSDTVKSKMTNSPVVVVRERDNSPGFQDNDEVPPLE